MADVATARGRTFAVQRFCLHDGPGIRTTIFLKGCPLECLWCHNPESQSLAPERVYLEARCIGCGSCEEACPHGAIRMVDDRPRLDPATCHVDGACAAVCPTGALDILGRPVDVDEVLRELRRDVLVFDESGGGVTFSGGEPLYQPDFLAAVLAACRAEGIHTTVDTSGHAPPAVVDRIGRLADAVLFDVKHPDDRAHRNLTGASNRLILENLTRLVALQRERGAPHITVRVPLVAGVNDGAEVAVRLAALLSGLDPLPPVQILPYQPLGEAKYTRLGRDYALSGARPPSSARLEAIRDILRAVGLTVTIRGEEEHGHYHSHA
jgi:pyruvate formate lyase activating enzyme